MTPSSTEPISVECGDEVWARLVAATARVVARKGYADTRIVDIAREAGEPTGAVFGRFRSKNDLLRQALVHLTVPPTELSS